MTTSAHDGACSGVHAIAHDGAIAAAAATTTANIAAAAATTTANIATAAATTTANIAAAGTASASLVAAALVNGSSLAGARDGARTTCGSQGHSRSPLPARHHLPATPPLSEALKHRRRLLGLLAGTQQRLEEGRSARHLAT